MEHTQLPYDVLPIIVDYVALFPTKGKTLRRYGHDPLVAATLRSLCLVNRLLGSAATRRLYATIAVNDAVTFQLLSRTLSESEPKGEKAALMRRFMLNVSYSDLRQVVRSHTVKSVIEWIRNYQTCPCIAIHPDLLREDDIAKEFWRLSKIGEMIALTGSRFPSSFGGGGSVVMPYKTPRWPYLRKLALGSVNISPSVLQAFKSFPDLRHLCLYLPKLDMTSSMPSLQTLIQSNQFPRLERITFAALSTVKNAFHLFARSARPGLQIVEVKPSILLREVDRDLWDIHGTTLTR